MNMLANGQTWLASTFKAHCSDEVTYHRGALSATVTAIIGRTQFDTLMTDGSAIRAERRDFLIAASEIDFGSGAVDPAEGDEIHETVGGVARVHVVRPIMQGGPVWGWVDGYNKTMRRIHTTEGPAEGGS